MEGSWTHNLWTVLAQNEICRHSFLHLWLLRLLVWKWPPTDRRKLCRVANCYLVYRSDLMSVWAKKLDHTEPPHDTRCPLYKEHRVPGPATVHAVAHILRLAFCDFIFRGNVGVAQNATCAKSHYRARRKKNFRNLPLEGSWNSLILTLKVSKYKTSAPVPFPVTL